MMKKIGFVILVFFLALLLGKDIIIKNAVTSIGSKALGAPISIDRFSWNIFFNKISAQGIKIDNPPGFGKETFIDIPEVTVQCNIWALIQGKLHLPLAVLDIRKVVVIKNKEGQLNIDALKAIEDIKKASEKEKATKEADKKDAPVLPNYPLQIDTLKVNVGQVIYKDYSKANGAPHILVYDVDLKNKTFTNINGLGQLITVVLTHTIAPTAIRSAGLSIAAALLGVSFLPAGILGVIVAKDSASATLEVNADKAFATTLKLLNELGEIKKEDASLHTISATINGCDIKVKVEKISRKETKITITARKFFLAQPAVAAGILYQIKNRL